MLYLRILLQIPHIPKNADNSAISQCLAGHISSNSSFTFPKMTFSHLLPCFRDSIFSDITVFDANTITIILIQRSYSSFASVTERCFPPVHPIPITSCVFPSEHNSVSEIPSYPSVLSRKFLLCHYSSHNPDFG